MTHAPMPDLPTALYVRTQLHKAGFRARVLLGARETAIATDASRDAVDALVVECSTV